MGFIIRWPQGPRAQTCQEAVVCGNCACMAMIKGRCPPTYQQVDVMGSTDSEKFEDLIWGSCRLLHPYDINGWGQAWMSRDPVSCSAKAPLGWASSPTPSCGQQSHPKLRPAVPPQAAASSPTSSCGQQSHPKLRPLSLLPNGGGLAKSMRSLVSARNPLHQVVGISFAVSVQGRLLHTGGLVFLFFALPSVMVSLLSDGHKPG